MRSALRFGVLALAACVAGARADDKPAAPPDGFTSIFNGKTLTGWKPTGKADVWAVENGLIVCKGGGGGWLLSEKDYGDFELRCEYRWEKKGGNSGVALRSPFEGNPDPAYVGMEIQLIDDEGWPDKLADYQHTGSIYDVQPAKPAKNKPIGEWNTVKIVCKGRQVTVVQNDVELVNADLDDYKAKYKKHPGLEREKGRVGFQSYNVRVEFKNVFIKELK
jgi:hypothetical protein